MGRTLFVSNLSVGVTEEMLSGKFARFGAVLSVTIRRDPSTGASQRCGVVEMNSALEAQAAVNGMNFTEFDGRVMSVNNAPSQHVRG